MTYYGLDNLSIDALMVVIFDDITARATPLMTLSGVAAEEQDIDWP